MLIKRYQTASFLVDAQRGFTPLCPCELPVPEGDKIVEECLLTFDKTRLKIASKDAHSGTAGWIAGTGGKGGVIATPIVNSPSAQMDVYWPRHCEVGTEGFELLPGLPPIEEFDYIIYKGAEKNIHPYSAVYHLLNPNVKGKRISTGVIEYLDANEIFSVVILGLATNYCCKTTALDLVEEGFEVIVNLGGCRGIGDIQPALREMDAQGVYFINSASELELE